MRMDNNLPDLKMYRNSSDANCIKQSNVESMGASKEPIVNIELQDTTGNGTMAGAHGMPVEHPTSYMETMMHLFKGNVGSGIYAMGDAFKNAGLFFGFGVTIFLGIISVHCQHILLTLSEDLQKDLKLSHMPNFAQTVELCFSTGPPKIRGLAVCMRRLVNMFLCVTQLGFCCVYFVFVSTNLKKILDHYDIVIDLHLLMVIAFIPILISCMVRNLKYLAPLSTLANILMIIGLSITLYYASIDLPSIYTRRFIADWDKIPLYFGTTIYAFEGIGLVLPLKSEMRKPKHFQKPLGVLNIGMVVVTILLIAVGFLGYLKWGDDVQGSLTLNLPEESILSIVIQGLLVVAIIFTYPIQFYVPVEIMWPFVQEKLGPFKSPVIAESVLRSLLVLLTFILAAAIPRLGLFISLVGAMSSTALALLFPPIIELVSKYQNFGKIHPLVIIKNASILLLGVLGFATGTYESLKSIIEAFATSSI